MSSPIEIIRACEFLYLRSISEPEDNSLRLVIEEARVSDSVDTATVQTGDYLERVLAGSKPIVHGPGCRLFELTWSTYIAYAVENESYAVIEPKESIGEGKRLVEYKKSVYLDYLAKATLASAEHPGPFTHWNLSCLNHVINVASTVAPIIEVR